MRNRQIFIVAIALLGVIATLVKVPTVSAQAVTLYFADPASAASRQWNVQVKAVDPAGVNLAASFQFAIYESLLDELRKTKKFEQVLRDSDNRAAELPDLLVLKTTVEKYSAGNETQRAVTTVSGATKLRVHSQLCTQSGEVLLDRTVDGKVLFMGSNLRATHNLARNIAKVIEKSQLPEPQNTKNMS